MMTRTVEASKGAKKSEYCLMQDDHRTQHTSIVTIANSIRTFLGHTYLSRANRYLCVFVCDVIVPVRDVTSGPQSALRMRRN